MCRFTEKRMRHIPCGCGLMPGESEEAGKGDGPGPGPGQTGPLSRGSSEASVGAGTQPSIEKRPVWS